MERVAKLDFGIFVPSHFGHGVKQDFVDSLALLKRVNQLAHEASERYGRPDEAPAPGFTYVYDRLSAEYGDWHGFDQMVLFNIVRTATGQLLGY